LTSSLLGTAKLNSQELHFALLKREREWNVDNGSRRGKMDIMAEILLFCVQQKSKTSIMYNANLNYSQLKSQMNSLLSQGLLEKKQDKYITTERGFRFLQLFAKINDLLDEFKNNK